MHVRPTVKLETVAEAAVRKNIIINTIFCGSPVPADAAGWKQFARLSEGRFASIDQNRGAVAIATRSTSDHLEISVANDGPGIPIEMQPRIFERFFRGDQTRTRGSLDGGAGLGLSIAKWIAEAHHGRLELTRSDSAGTVFTAHLPKSGSTSSSTN